MKKLILLLFVVFILTSCGVDTFDNDPSLKESERIAVLEKAKTDTTTTVVEMDNSIYILKKNEIKAKTEKEKDDIGFFFMMGFIIGGVIIGIIVDKINN